MRSVSVVIVTFNRIGCLKRVIDSVINQTIKVDNILVINNGSTDGTKEWLDSQPSLTVIHQDNVGGSGGFYRGIQEAVKLGPDWIWCMDDDVYPRPDSLANLLKQDNPKAGILCPRRIQNDKVFISEFRYLNLSNPFRALHLKKLNKEDITSDAPVKIMGMVFEGPLIKREVVEKIGLPNKDLFILYDDTDYSYRAVVAGYDVLYVPNAILDKEYFNQNLTREQFLRKNRWKEWYHIRNTAFFCHHHGKNIFFRSFGGIGLPIKMFFAILYNLPLNNKYEWGDQWKVIKMFIRGRKGKLGKM